MSLSASDRKITYIGNDVTVAFSFDFKIADEDHIQVVVVDSGGSETVLTKTTDYTVSGVGNGAGGTVTLVDADQAWLSSGSNGLATGYSIYLVGDTPTTQETDIRNQGSYYASLHEDALDKVTMICQELEEKLKRAVLYKLSSGYSDKFFPVPTEDSILTWDGAGNLINLPLASIVGGTYTGNILKYPSTTHTTGALVIPSSAVYSVVFVTGAAAKTITLPSASAVGAGRVFLVVSDANASVTTVQRGGSDTIEGSASAVSYNTPYKHIYFISDGGTNWRTTVPKAGDITSAMIATGAVGGDKWLHTLGGPQTANFTISLTNVGYYPCNSTAGSFTVTLISAASCQGKVFSFKNIGTANTVTLDGNGSQTINGSLTLVLAPGDSCSIISNSAGWEILSYTTKNLVVATSSQHTATGATGRFNGMTGNSLALPQGRWRLTGMATFNSSGGSAAYVELGTGWAAANGNDTSTQPTVLSSGTNIAAVESAFITTTGFQNYLKGSAQDSQFIQFQSVIIRTSGAATVYGNTYQVVTTAANVRVVTYLTAERLGE